MLAVETLQSTQRRFRSSLLFEELMALVQRCAFSPYPAAYRLLTTYT